MRAQFTGRFGRGPLAEAFDNFQRDVAEQISRQAETAQALEFDDLGEDALQTYGAGVRLQFIEAGSARLCLGVGFVISTTGQE